MLKHTALALSLYAGITAAQTPTPQADPKVSAPAAAAHTQPGQRSPAASRDQFFSPVMGIQIEGQGLTLPKGVADEEPIVKPAAETPATPASPPASTAK